MLFLSDLSRQESDKCTTSQQEFDATECRMGHGRYVSQTTNTRWRQLNQMFRTRDRRAVQSTRRFQPTFLALLKMRGFRTAQSARILELQIEIEQLELLTEFTKRARCEITRRTTPTDDV